jgi:CPA2 family monovalent cation:H+ antiporter-2
LATIGNLDAYSDALVVLGTAGIVVPLVRRFGLSPVLGYLGAGAILGPLGLGTFKEQFPALYWLTVVDTRHVSALAELGVVFLLFLIGLELSYQRLLTMRRLVFGLGFLQVLLSASAIAAVVAWAGTPAAAAVIIGSCLALSSTAIVIEVLSNQRRMSTATGRTSFSILLAQDIAVVPILILVAVLQNGAFASSLPQGIMLAFAQAGFAFGVIILVGRLMLRPLFRLVASVDTTELFVATTLFVIVAAAVVAGLSGVSMALGAFVAGLMLAETEFRKAIEATIDPFKGLLLGLFFFTVGMSIDFRELAREPLWILVSVVGLIGLKASIIIGLARAFRIPAPAAVETGLLLGPGGEFAFVVIGVATAATLVSPGTASFTLAVTSITMAIIPLLASAARRLTRHREQVRHVDPALSLVPMSGAKGRAIVIGHGRVGQVVCDMLSAHNFPYIATDRDPGAVTQQRRKGREVYYGNAADPAFLNSCGLMEAAAVIVTIHDQPGIDEIVRAVRERRPDILIVSRARDADHARHLYEIGVTDAVPETIEASLQLSEATLVGLGVPTGPVIASIHEKRDEFRHTLQEAAGREGSRAIRAKSLRSRTD